MSQILKLRRSAVEGKRPTNSQLELGELSINTTDGKIYFAKSGSLNASIEEVVSTNTQNTGSLNLSGSINLIGTESITGTTKITGSLSVTGNTSFTSLVVSGTDPVANVQVFVPPSSVYNSASFNTPDRVASGIRFNWNNEDWTIGASRGLTTDIDGLLFSKNGVRKYMIDEDGDASLSGSLYVTGSIYGTLTGSLSGSINGRGQMDYLTFNSSSIPTVLPDYTFAVNLQDRTLDLKMGNNATNQIGQELFYPPVVNKTNEILTDGTLVMVNPTTPTFGGRLNIQKAITDGTYSADLIVGVLTEDIAINGEGFATWFGYVRQITMSHLVPNGETWVEGNVLYPHPTIAGKMTNITPTAPALKSTIAVVTYVNGGENHITILVRPNLRGSINGQHDVNITTGVTTGDLFVRSGSLWTNSKNLNGEYDLSGSLNISGSLYINGDVVGTGKLDSTEFYSYTSSATSTIASSSYAETASYVLNPIVVSGVTRTSTVLSPTATWSFNHQMGQRYPSIQIFDNDGYVVIPSEIKAVDENNVSVYFSQPQTGILSVTLGGAGTAGTSGTSGTSGRDGLGGYSQTYTALTTWSVAHNLGMDFPVVTAWDTNRKVILPTEVYSVDSNNIEVYFSQPIAGTISVIKIL
jgi:cytoskeletal protein CcmA (bactofilin family)